MALCLSKYSNITPFQYAQYVNFPKPERGFSGVPGIFSILDRR